MREIISPKGLRWDQVELMETGGCIRLAAVQTKTKRARVIYLSGDFLRVMRKAKEFRDRDYPACSYVCHRNGKPFSNLRHGWMAGL